MVLVCLRLRVLVYLRVWERECEGRCCAGAHTSQCAAGRHVRRMRAYRPAAVACLPFAAPSQRRLLLGAFGVTACYCLLLPELAALLLLLLLLLLVRAGVLEC